MKELFSSLLRDLLCVMGLHSYKVKVHYNGLTRRRCRNCGMYGHWSVTPRKEENQHDQL